MRLFIEQMNHHQLHPQVSVIMPVYNGEKYLAEAINSILGQTFHEFELIIINDGSHDSSADIVRSYTDPRIVFIENEINTGLPRVRNQGLYTSRGQYIAWLDCDDVSVPERLEIQVKFLDEHPRIGVCGGWIKMVGDGKETVARYPADPGYIRASMLFNNFVVNSTVMMRAACTREVGLRFDLSHHLSQDYGLWVRIPEPWQITNLPKVLTRYRLHTSQVTTIHKQKQIDVAWKIQKEQLASLAIIPTDKERLIHLSLSGLVQHTFENPNQVFEVREYLVKLNNANKQYKRYNQKAFRYVLFEKWWGVGRSSSLSIKKKLISCWKIFKFDIVSFDLLLRAINKLGQRFPKTKI
jgi:glycosyltransferase involved in cell wall biosynthesis